MGGQDEGKAGGLPWEPLHLESKGASKEPDNKKPEGQDFNKEAMASYKEEEQNIWRRDSSTTSDVMGEHWRP